MAHRLGQVGDYLRERLPIGASQVVQFHHKDLQVGEFGNEISLKGQTVGNLEVSEDDRFQFLVVWQSVTLSFLMASLHRVRLGFLSLAEKESRGVDVTVFNQQVSDRRPCQLLIEAAI